jgi:hypothetical protein
MKPAFKTIKAAKNNSNALVCTILAQADVLSEELLLHTAAVALATYADRRRCLSPLACQVASVSELRDETDAIDASVVLRRRTGKRLSLTWLLSDPQRPSLTEPKHNLDSRTEVRRLDLGHGMLRACLLGQGVRVRTLWVEGCCTPPALWEALPPHPPA